MLVAFGGQAGHTGQFTLHCPFCAPRPNEPPTNQVSPMKRIFIALALAFALTGVMVVATVFGHADKASADGEIQSPL
jgi:hypothetical protein